MKKRLDNRIKLMVISIFTIALFGFTNYNLDNSIVEPVAIKHVKYLSQNLETRNLLYIKGDNKKINIPFVSKDFVGFKEALAFKESQGDYNRINTYGFLGKYQFGRSTLKELDIKNLKEFLKDPELQEKAFLANLRKNKWILRKEIEFFNGKKINGIIITESGILAAAHLGGAGAVRKFLWSYGQNTMKDAFGTKIESYLKKFSGYDLSNIIPNKQPLIN